MPNVLSCDDALTDQRVQVQCENARPVPCRIVNVNSLITTSVANLAALAALSTTTAPDGTVVWVQSLARPFVRDPVLGAPIDGQVVTATGGGSWRSLGDALSNGASPWPARTDWHINATTGTVEGTGSAASPINSWRELATRLNGQQLGAGTIVTVHGGLNEVIDASRFIPDPTTPFFVNGDAGATVVATDTVATYTAQTTVAPGEAPLLTANGIADWTPYQEMRIRFIDGPAAGAYCVVARANPNGAGINVARICRPITPAHVRGTPRTPAAGNTFVIETLPPVLGIVPPAAYFGPPATFQGLALPETAWSTRPLYTFNTMTSLWACTMGDLRVFASGGNLQACRCGKDTNFRFDLRNGDWDIDCCVFYWALFYDTNVDTRRSVFQQGLAVGPGYTFLSECGFFDGSSTNDGILLGAAGGFVQAGSILYGSNNGGFGVNVTRGSSSLSYAAGNRPVIAGAGGSFRVAGVTHALWADAPIAVAADLAGVITP